MQQHMIQCFFTHTGSHHEYFQVLDHLGLSAEIMKRKRSERILILSFTFRHTGVPYIKIVFHIFAH